MKSLVIVESPTKAKTIKKFLPKNEFIVDSCNGHIRDLPASAKEVPASYKKKKWANLGINVDKNYEPLYVISSQKKKTVKRLKELLEKADELILATDEDREGEGISWHLLEVLKPKIPVKRMVFHEITKEAILKALDNYREVDMNLVQAQEARRIIDRLAGYTISPLLWKKIAPGLSAGRVQSVAVELVVQRERERLRFKSGSYWDLKANLSKKGQSADFDAQLSSLNGKRVASGKDFDENTGSLKKPDAVVLLDQKAAEELQKSLKSAQWKVAEVEKNEQKRSPAPPFITSTLQQEANRKFGFSAKDTMRTAQKLYEEGFITYMRTDSTNLSSQAITAARTAVSDMYGDDYLFERVRSYNKKSKGAQEAHEAIRPAGSEFKKPDETGLSGAHFKLYDLIWKRTIATQMAEARLEFTNASISAVSGDTQAEFKASGKRILFPGFFRAYVEGSDDPEAEILDKEKVLPNLLSNDALDCRKVEALSHETKPPARFTEATLVKELEKEGVGRPSTYASIIGTIQDRGYVEKKGNALVPTFTAFAVTELLEEHFPDMVDVGFTSALEKRLDDIAQGDEDHIYYLSSYYEGESGLKSQVERQESQIDPQKAKRVNLPIEGLKDQEIELFVGRFGPYAQIKTNGEVTSASLPYDMAPSDLSLETIDDLLKKQESGPDSLGKDPETGEHIYVLSGRYGPYVQLGEVTEETKKPKRASLLKGMKAEDVDLKTALDLLSLPRVLGNHPETGKEIKAGVGRFGPFVVHDGTFGSLGKEDDVLSIGLDRALELLSKKKSATRGSSVIQDLGEHPETGQPVVIMSGRYGPYIKYGKKNISLPKGTDAEKLNMGKAIDIIKTKG